MARISKDSGWRLDPWDPPDARVKCPAQSSKWQWADAVSGLLDLDSTKAQPTKAQDHSQNTCPRRNSSGRPLGSCLYHAGTERAAKIRAKPSRVEEPAFAELQKIPTLGVLTPYSSGGHHTSWQNVQAAVDERMPPRHWRPQRAATWSLLNEVPSSVLGHSTFKVRPHRSAGSGRHGLGRVCGTRKASGHAGANCSGSAASSAPTPAQTVSPISSYDMVLGLAYRWRY